MIIIKAINIKMINIKALILLAFLTGHVAAADFNYEIPLSIDLNAEAKEATGFSIQIPQEVYLNTENPYLRDVRVKNVQGDEVPMRLTLSDDESIQTVSTATLPIFSLNQTIETPRQTKQVNTSWQGDEQQLNVTTSESIQNYISSQETVLSDRFLLDATALKQATVSALELKWQFDQPGNRVFYVELKGSNDLSNWQIVHPRFKLIELNTGQQVVLENSLPIHNKSFSYYQLRFMGEPVPMVSEVKAVMSRHASMQPLIMREVTSFEVLDTEKHGHAVTWDSGGFFPVENIQIDFDYKNLMADVQLYSRATQQANWQRVLNSQLYQVGSGEMAMEKNTLSISSNHHRYWKLSTQSSISSQWIKGVTLLWRPHQLQFLAQGNAPYRMLFGHKEQRSMPSNRWYQQLNQQVRNELFSDQITLGSMKKITPTPKAPEPMPESQTSRWVFWGLLGVVLSGLFYMASRLMKEVAVDRD